MYTLHVKIAGTVPNVLIKSEVVPAVGNYIYLNESTKKKLVNLLSSCESAYAAMAVKNINDYYIVESVGFAMCSDDNLPVKIIIGLTNF